jgi:hypothetical protein
MRREVTRAGELRSFVEVGSTLQSRANTYLLRQIMRAEVEGCGALTFGGVMAAGGLGGTESSDASPAV